MPHDAKFGHARARRRFAVDSLAYQAMPASLRPYLSVVADQGCDGVCASNFLQWGPWRCAVERLDDLGHGVHNDIELATAKTGLSAHQLLMKLSRNCAHGPWGEGVRFGETSAAVREYCALFMEGSTCPFFVSLAPSMLEDRGEQHRACDDGIVQELFEDFQSSIVFTNLGSKVAAPRFCSAIHACREQDSAWTIGQLGFLITCLTSGLYSQEKFQEGFHTKKLPVPVHETEHRRRV